MILMPTRDFDEINCLAKQDVVCFGAGKALINMIRLCSKEPFVGSIKYIIDNDAKKWGRSIHLSENIELTVVSPDFLSDNSYAIDAIIVTNANPTPIFDQIESLLKGRNIKVFLYPDIMEVAFKNNIQSAQIPANIKMASNQLIPKIIHYCWFGGNPIPQQYREWMQSWKRYCPDYEIIEWNESNYDYKKHKYMRDAYAAKKWAFVSDYARLDIVYNYGGIYLDVDVEVVKNLDDFLYQKGFGGYQSDQRFNTGLGFGAVQQHPLIREFLDSYDSISFEDFSSKEERRKKRIKTCPDIQTQVLNEKGYYWNNKVTDVDGFRIYPAPVFDGMISLDHKLILTENSYTLHHYSGSWMSTKE